MIYLKRDREVHPSKGTGNEQQKACNLFCNIAATKLKIVVARFTTHVQTCQQPDLVQARFEVGGKTRNISIQLILQRCCKTRCMIFVASFSVP